MRAPTRARASMGRARKGRELMRVKIDREELERFDGGIRSPNQIMESLAKALRVRVVEAEYTRDCVFFEIDRDVRPTALPYFVRPCA